MKKIFFTLTLGTFLFLTSTQQIIAQQEGFLGEIKLFAGNFAPKYWMYCDGQTLQISQNSALFSLLGTQFGGNGTSTFALPKLNNIATATTQVIAPKPGVGEARTGTSPNTNPTSPNIARSPGGGADIRYIICVQGVYPSRP